MLVANDVRLASDLSDYTGEVDLRPTFRAHRPRQRAAGAATVLDLQLSFRSAVRATANTTAGADCNLATTADAVMPGLIKESQRMLMEGLDPVRVFDGGADGDSRHACRQHAVPDAGDIHSVRPAWLELPASSRSRRCWSCSDRSIIRAKKIANAITSTIDCSTIITTPPTLRSSSGERPQVRGTPAYAS